MRVQLSASPRKPPGDGFPVASVGTSLGLRRFEAPNGYHEEQAARVHRAGRADSRRVFAALCGLADDAEEEANKFTSTDLDVIDAALETVSPDIADETQSICPGCGEATVARIEPLRFGLPRENEVLRSTHRLACAYGWAEETILALPTARRLKYEGLIAADEQRGIVQRRL
jgi:hypothetical protein